MIIAKIQDAHRYAAINDRLRSGFDFLRQPDLSALADGRHEIDGDDVFAIVARGIGRGQADSPLEFHRRYLDIQYVVSGLDLIGWLPLSECKHPAGEFDTERDLGFVADRPATWLRVSPEGFAIFFPEDAHAPLGGSGPYHKVVVKVLLPNA